MFRAFADRTRLRILSLLQNGELCVSDIIAILEVPQAKASHHLNYLHRAGIVEVRKQGLWCFYQLSPTQSPFHQKLIECLGECFASVPGLKKDRARAARVKASGGCCPSGHRLTPPLHPPSAGLCGRLDGQDERTACGKLTKRRTR